MTKIDINTVYNYLDALESAFILYRIPRYDIKGKEILKTQEKFYIGDISIVYATMGIRDRMISGILENSEIDFVAEKQGNKIYIQVAYKLENEQTIEREFGNLLSINDQYPKYVVTMDESWKDSIEGIKHLCITDFLLRERY